MSETVKMPALGESVTEGTVTRWLKAVGDTVEVEIDKLGTLTNSIVGNEARRESGRLDLSA